MTAFFVACCWHPHIAWRLVWNNNKPCEKGITFLEIDIHAMIEPLERSKGDKIMDDDENAFIDQLCFASNRQWAESYFNLIEQIVQLTGLDKDDPRLVTSVIRGKTYFPVSINNRYILSASKHDSKIRIICQQDFISQPELHLGVSFAFKQLPRERKYNLIPPIMVRLEMNNFPSELYEGWQESIKSELARATSSPYRKFHNPYVYQAATDHNYRDMALSFAFG
jgi:5-methylcytosine-specific restriction protein A